MSYAVELLLQIGSFKEGNKARYTTVETTKREGGVVAGPMDPLRQPLLQPVTVVEEEV